MHTFKLIFFVFAFVCFVFEAWRHKSVTAAGLAFWVATQFLV